MKIVLFIDTILAISNLANKIVVCKYIFRKEKRLKFSEWFVARIF
jgi:hypothetical protein